MKKQEQCTRSFKVILYYENLAISNSAAPVSDIWVKVNGECDNNMAFFFARKSPVHISNIAKDDTFTKCLIFDLCYTVSHLTV